MTVIIRSFNEPTIMMVDSNLQRENILPSEKAKSYIPRQIEDTILDLLAKWLRKRQRETER